ncbi:MAG: hypothetical protein IRZ00_10760 [Gemmatimonadetes bacterium]|nr:hypothetical protein [Gemmatimonadota bacterium]
MSVIVGGTRTGEYMKRVIVNVSILIILSNLAPSCKSEATGPLKSPPDRIVIEGPDSIAVGDTASFTSRIFGADGREIDRLLPAWRSDAPEVASSLGGGKFVALRVGQTRIAASVGVVFAERLLTVVERPRLAADQERRVAPGAGAPSP